MRCRWCKEKIWLHTLGDFWVHAVTSDGRHAARPCEPDMQSQMAEPEPDISPESETAEDDAWKQVDDLRRRFTKEWEVRSDLAVTALGVNRNVRLRVGEWSFNKTKSDPRDFTPEPQITDRNVKTMRELAEAILEACEFVEKSNPKWASLPSPSITRVSEVDADLSSVYDLVERGEHLCSVPGCGRDASDEGWPTLIYITVLTSPGEEGYAEVTQVFCQEHYEVIAPALMALGFKSHNHHGTNLLDAGCLGNCPTPAEYGPELVQPAVP